MRRGPAWSVAIVALLGSCSAGGDAPAPAADQLAAIAAPPVSDAATPPIEVHDPSAGSSADDVVELLRPRPSRPGRRRRTVEIVLRSTPPGATAAVDGSVVGPTPAFWQGEVTEKPMEFTFVLPEYAMARYRFVPVQSGIVHATLRKLMVEPPDAGPR